MCPLSEPLLYLHDFVTIPVPLKTCEENFYYQNSSPHFTVVIKQLDYELEISIA